MGIISLAAVHEFFVYNTYNLLPCFSWIILNSKILLEIEISNFNAFVDNGLVE